MSSALSALRCILACFALAFCIFWGGVNANAQPNCTNQPTGTSDKDILIRFYCATGGITWTDNTNWGIGTDINTWHGVTADTSGVVQNLELLNNDLSGTIPTELGNLGSLLILNLGENQLSGPIPTELGKLANLQTLYLHKNKLSGTIPTQLGNLQTLNYLSLGGNQLSGTIPTQLGSLANLFQLYLYENKLSGTIPTEFHDNLQVSLTRLYLQNNQLSGTIPTELGDMDYLRELYLQNNKLSGTIPAQLGNLSFALHQLSLAHNQLSGTIPTELGNLQNLKWLDLSNNRLSGTIPTELGKLLALQQLWLNDNQLSETIPAELGNLLALQQLWLNDNQLSGTIPAELGKLQFNLTRLYLQNNQLSGTIPTLLGNLGSLQRLYLNNNQLSGTIPTELGKLQLQFSLTELSLAHNQLSGTIPVELTNMLALQRLWLNDNQLSGTITLGGLHNLKWLDLSNNQLSGEIPLFVDLDGLPSLEELGFWGNSQQLTWDTISDELGWRVDRAALRSIYDSNNGANWRNKGNWFPDGEDAGEKFSFSSWYGVMTNNDGRVSGLNLRGNGLTGEITNAFEVMGGLKSLNLSYNRPLRGTLPLRLKDIELTLLDIRCTNLSTLTLSELPEGVTLLRGCPPPPLPPPFINNEEGVQAGRETESGFPLTPREEEGSFDYRRRAINISVTRDPGLSPDDNPTVIVPRSVLDRVYRTNQKITFDLSEVSQEDSPSGFRLEGFTAEIDLVGVTLRPGETVTVCLPPAEVEGESYIHRYDEASGEWKLLESQQLQTVNDDDLLCGETDAVSLFGVFIPVIESAQGVVPGGETESGFPLTPLGAGGNIVYGERTINLSVTGDVDPSSGDPAVIVPRSVLDRVEGISFELSEDSPPQGPPSGFRLGGLTAEIDLVGVTLEEEETVTVCLPRAEVEGKSYIHRYDEASGEWELLESQQLQTVNDDDLLCGETDAVSLFGVFIPVIESAQGVVPGGETESGFPLTPLGAGGNIVYGERTINLSVTGDVDPSSGDPAVIVPRSVLDRVLGVSFELSEDSPHPPPSGLRLAGFAAEVDLGVTLGTEETVTVCLPSAGGDIYRYSEASEEWELLESQPQTVNGEEVVCAEVGAVSLVGVFVEETGGCVIAAANGEGTVRWQRAVFNLLFTISVMLLIPGRNLLRL